MKKHLLLVSFCFLANYIFSQHEHHMMSDTVPKKRDTMQMKPATKKMATMDSVDHSMHMMHSMPSHAYSCHDEDE